MNAAHQITLTHTRDELWLGHAVRAEDAILKAKSRAWQLLRSGASSDVTLTTSDGHDVARLTRVVASDDVHVVDHWAGTDTHLNVPVKRAA